MRPVLPRAAGALALLAAAAPAVAQPSTPPTIDACFVPTSGTIYRIDTPTSPAPGAPKQCLTSLHVRFGWVALPKLPTGALDLSTPAGLVSLGSTAGPALQLGGPGTRLVWYPRKAAFRAGNVDGFAWDDPNIGQFSTAFGLNTTADGIAAFAVGSGTRATGLGAVAVGNVTNAVGLGAFVAGSASQAAGDLAFGGGGAVVNGRGATGFGDATIAQGAGAFAAGQSASARGDHAVAIGQEVFASGAGAVALGHHVAAPAGTFFFGDGTSTAPLAGNPNSFLVRASGGAIFFSNAAQSAGVVLAAGGGSWQSLSDVRKKTAFQDVDGERLLGRLAALPVRTWQYRSQPASVRHMGPTAQDFRRAFALGESDTTITSVDADGVALAAARALERRTRALRRENAALRASADTLRRRLAAVERTLASVTAIHDIAHEATHDASPARAARRPARAPRPRRAN